MSRTSAGILMYQRHGDEVRVLLTHPGGPYWRNKDEGAWTVPKGEPGPGEPHDVAARREFEEELGTAVIGPLQPLGGIRQRGGKRVEAFAVQGDFDVGDLRSNTFEIEWPPDSGQRASFPEVDRAAWFALPEARRMILASQQELLDRLENLLRASPG